MNRPKIDVTASSLVFLCAYAVWDPCHSFFPFLLSVLAHEGGHLIAMLVMKLPIFGFRASLSGIEIQTGPLTYFQELMISIPGPGMNFLLILVFTRISPVMTLVNGMLLLYNLLPFYPLDGGRILRALLRMMLPLRVGEVIEHIIMWMAFVILAVAALYLSFVLHSGMWPIMFCGFLFVRISECIFVS